MSTQDISAKEARRDRSRKYMKELSTVFALIAIWAVLAIISEYFLTISNFSNIFLQSANVMIIALGLTFVLICGSIDLSVGSLEALAGAVVAVAIINHSVPMWLAIIIGLLVGLACGFVSGFLVAHFNFPPFVATLSMQGIARGLALITTNGSAVFGFPDSFKFLGQGKLGMIPVPVILFAILVVIGYFVLNHTPFGINVFATGGNEEAAKLSGINVAKINMAVLMISGTLSALAGIIMTSRLNSGQGTIGETDVMDAIAAVVIGGTSLNGGSGSIRGTVIGVMIVVSIRNGLNILGVTAYWQLVCIGVIIIAAILIDQLSKGKLIKK